MGPDSISQQPSQDGKQRSASSTSLKWGNDGELSPVDLQRVLERLTNPDLTQCNLNGENRG
ncbi:hypothetical protein MY494_03170 [Synechococcus sp. A10-1-5-1]|uniref:hypothetical protein n=1 Tax=Synechococcus sp. A10-1-5-1 TaxID=2936507 RepID=UPI002000C2AF|nr:hypothetical protein [Synechococcus sp. A10-1-5-1]UPM50801.1 hypothetical protein MY494_03170 [Synechococcus sp. A10-1-5-1]